MGSRTERETVQSWDQGDDAEAALEELIGVMVRREPAAIGGSVRVRRDEFVCRNCHMVQHQSRLADVRKLICSECITASARQRH
jgi:hypothetical protein